MRQPQAASLPRGRSSPNDRKAPFIRGPEIPPARGCTPPPRPRRQGQPAAEHRAGFATVAHHGTRLGEKPAATVSICRSRSSRVIPDEARAGHGVADGGFRGRLTTGNMDNGHASVVVQRAASKTRGLCCSRRIHWRRGQRDRARGFGSLVAPPTKIAFSGQPREPRRDTGVNSRLRYVFPRVAGCRAKPFPALARPCVGRRASRQWRLRLFVFRRQRRPGRSWAILAENRFHGREFSPSTKDFGRGGRSIARLVWQGDRIETCLFIFGGPRRAMPEKLECGQGPVRGGCTLQTTRAGAVLFGQNRPMARGCRPDQSALLGVGRNNTICASIAAGGCSLGRRTRGRHRAGQAQGAGTNLRLLQFPELETAGSGRNGTGDSAQEQAGRPLRTDIPTAQVRRASGAVSKTMWPVCGLSILERTRVASSRMRSNQFHRRTGERHLWCGPFQTRVNQEQ